MRKGASLLFTILSITLLPFTLTQIPPQFLQQPPVVYTTASPPGQEVPVVALQPQTDYIQQVPATTVPTTAPVVVQEIVPVIPIITEQEAAPVQPVQPVNQIPSAVPVVKDAQTTSEPPKVEQKPTPSIPKSSYDTYYRPMDTEDSNNPNAKFGGIIDTKMNYIDAPIVDIVWCGEKKNVIFMLTAKNTLYRSQDDGFTGHMLSEHLHKLGKTELGNLPGEVGEVSRIIQSPLDKNLLLIMGTHGINWVTENCGASFKAMDQGRRVDEFQLHPTERTWLLASAWTLCDDFVGEPCRNYKELFVSQDLGQNWAIVSNYVFQFAWATFDSTFLKIPKERIIISHDPLAKGNQTETGWKKHLVISYTDDFGKSTNVFVQGGNKFLLTTHFLFVVTVQGDTSENEISMLVGNPKEKNYVLRQIEIPAKRILEHGYSVLDASEHSVFLHVDHGVGNNYGSLYVSDSTGVRYSLALKHNVKDFSGQSDFERVQGLEGIYLANIFDADMVKRFQNMEADFKNEFPMQHSGSKKTSDDAFKHPDRYVPDLNVHTKANRADSAMKTLADFKKTMISFDKGGIWQPIIPPEKDVYGKKIICKSEEECALHLHSVSSKNFGPFYTTANSLGLILGTGNIGEFLSNYPDQINTYLSRDGGLTWFEIAKGSHIYDVGDHGGLIVIAPDQNATKEVFYSWNEGMTWEAVKISDEFIHVSNIIIEPSNTGEKFIIYGKEANGQRGVIAAIDFSSLHTRTCVFPSKPDTPESDYETWTPNGRLSPHCLLGRQVTYVRRKRESKCFNAEEHEEWKSFQPCACTEEDWECDYGYYRHGSGACLAIDDKLKNETVNPPDECDSYYYMTQGYRKIAGDTCQGGVNHQAIRMSCPGTGVLTAKNLGILVVLGGIVMVFMWLNNSANTEKVKKMFDGLKGVFKRKEDPAKQGYMHHIPSKFADEEDNFGNIIFDEEETDERRGDTIDVIENEQNKKMTERKAMDAAKKQVPLLNKPGDKRLDTIRGGL